LAPALATATAARACGYFASSCRVWATSAFAWPWPIPCSALSQFTSSICFCSGLERIKSFHSPIGLPYFLSIEGKYEAGPSLSPPPTLDHSSYLHSSSRHAWRVSRQATGGTLAGPDSGRLPSACSLAWRSEPPLASGG